MSQGPDHDDDSVDPVPTAGPTTGPTVGPTAGPAPDGVSTEAPEDLFGRWLAHRQTDDEPAPMRRPGAPAAGGGPDTGAAAAPEPEAAADRPTSRGGHGFDSATPREFEPVVIASMRKKADAEPKPGLLSRARRRTGETPTPRGSAGASPYATGSTDPMSEPAAETPPGPPVVPPPDRSFVETYRALSTVVDQVAEPPAPPAAATSSGDTVAATPDPPADQLTPAPESAPAVKRAPARRRTPAAKTAAPAAKKVAVKKAPAAKKVAAKKAPAATDTTDAPAASTPVREATAATPATKTAAKAPVKKAVAKKTVATKTVAKKTAAKAPVKKTAAAGAPVTRAPAKKAPAKKVPATRAPAEKAAPTPTATQPEPGAPPIDVVAPVSPAETAAPAPRAEAAPRLFAEELPVETPIETPAAPAEPAVLSDPAVAATQADPDLVEPSEPVRLVEPVEPVEPAAPTELSPAALPEPERELDPDPEPTADAPVPSPAPTAAPAVTAVTAPPSPGRRAAALAGSLAGRVRTLIAPTEDRPTLPSRPSLARVTPPASPAVTPPVPAAPAPQAQPAPPAAPTPAPTPTPTPAPTSADDPRTARDHGEVVFTPRTGLRQIASLLLAVSAVAAVVFVLLAIQDQTAFKVAAAIATIALSGVIWATRASSSVTRMRIRTGQLEVVDASGKFVFDLHSPFTRIEEIGRPGSRAWRVVFARLDLPPFVVTRSMVDPHEFSRVLRVYRKPAD